MDWLILLVVGFLVEVKHETDLQLNVFFRFSFQVPVFEVFLSFSFWLFLAVQGQQKIHNATLFHFFIQLCVLLQCSTAGQVTLGRTTASAQGRTTASAQFFSKL